MAKQFPFEEEFVLGMKSNWRQKHLQARFDAIPELRLVEFFIGEYDLEEHRLDIEKSMKEMAKRGAYVMLHEPTLFHGIRVNAAATDKEQQKATRECHSKLEDMCESHENAAGFVCHGYNPPSPDTLGYVAVRQAREKRNALLNHVMEGINLRYKHAFVENVPRKVFAKTDEITGIAAATREFNEPGIGICLDLPALSMTYKFKAFQSMDDAAKSIAKFSRDNLVPLYFHIGDEKGYKDSLEVGTGTVHFDKIVPHIKVGMIEVRPRNELNPVEAVRSYKAIMEMRQRERYWEITREAGDRMEQGKR